MKKKLVYLGIILLIVTYLLSVRATRGNFNSGDSILETHTIYNMYEYQDMPFEFPRSRTQYTTLIALANDFRFDLDYELALAGYPDTAEANGMYFSFANVGLAVISLPFFLLGSIWGLNQAFAALFVGIIGVLNVLGIYYLSRKLLAFTTGGSLLAAGIYGFATTTWTYSTSFIYHTPVNFCVIAIIICTYRLIQSNKKRDQIKYSSLIWILFGMILFLDNPAFIALFAGIPTIAFIIWKNYRDRLAIFVTTSIWLVLFLLVAAFSQQMLYGNWKELSNDQSILKPQVLRDGMVSTAPKEEVLADKSFVRLEQSMSLKYVPINSYINLLSTQKGIFIVHIILIFSFLGCGRRTKYLFLAYIPTILSVVLLYSSFIVGGGAGSFGARYMQPLLPLLSIMSAYAIYTYRKKFLFYWSSFLMLIFSILTSASPAMSRFHNSTPFTDGYFGIHNLTFILEDRTSMLIYNFWLRDIMPLWPIYLIVCIALSIYTFYLYRFILTEKENDSWQKIDSQS